MVDRPCPTRRVPLPQAEEPQIAPLQTVEYLDISSPPTGIAVQSE